MEQELVNKAIEKLREDPDFQNAMKRYQEADESSHKYSLDMAKQMIDILHLQDTNQTIEQARYNLLVAKMSAAKLLATLSSFSYEEKDFMEAVTAARLCVQQELVPMLMQKEPCGQCEACKNGHPDRCIKPKIRESHVESRFLPLLSESLIEYDAWNEILYNNIPQDKRDIDILKDIDDEFHDNIVELQPKKRKGRPTKKENGGE